ncbi:hypothetical protein MTO96_022618 [Rhipicephalus appendiculatus]
MSAPDSAHRNDNQRRTFKGSRGLPPSRVTHLRLSCPNAMRLERARDQERKKGATLFGTATPSSSSRVGNIMADTFERSTAPVLPCSSSCRRGDSGEAPLPRPRRPSVPHLWPLECLLPGALSWNSFEPLPQSIAHPSNSRRRAGSNYSRKPAC